MEGRRDRRKTESGDFRGAEELEETGVGARILPSVFFFLFVCLFVFVCLLE